MSKHFGLEEAIVAIEDSIARMQSVKTDDEIVAWVNNGLGVNCKKGQCGVVGVHLASSYQTIRRYRGDHATFTNGKGEVARIVRRQVAIAHSIAQLRTTIENLRKMGGAI